MQGGRAGYFGYSPFVCEVCVFWYFGFSGRPRLNPGCSIHFRFELPGNLDDFHLNFPRRNLDLDHITN